ncbi:MAG: hypothetical protein U0354_01430 [Candidatus Sericytochromatia bacterium]
MSDFDEELEDDFNESSSSDDVADDFSDPQQSTAALTREINKLRQKNEGLRQYNVRQKERYKDEVRSFLSPLIQKYKDIQSENEFLKRQIKEISQNTATLSLAKQNGENGGNGLTHESDPVKILENNIEEKEREIAVLNKMVKTLQEEATRNKRDMAELPELKDTLKTKNDKISQLEEEKYDLSSKIEAKDTMLAKYLNQISEFETNTYVLNKRLSERVGQIENGKVSEYESKLSEANKKINDLNQKIDSLEKQLSDYQDTMNSLEEELDEDKYMQKAATVAGGAVVGATVMNLAKQDEPLEEHIDDDELLSQIDSFDDIDESHEDLNTSSQTAPYDYSKHYDETNEESMDLPSDDDLLSHDIELEEMHEDEHHEQDVSHESISDDDISLEHEFDDNEIDLPLDEELDLETDSDLLDGIDLNSIDDDNPLNDFEMSDDALDEDRDMSHLLKKKN